MIVTSLGILVMQNSPTMPMPRALRPVSRSPRRSRRRQMALACGMLSYLAAFASGVLALLSLIGSAGHVALLCIFAAGALAMGGLTLWGADAALGAHERLRVRHRLSA